MHSLPILRKLRPILAEAYAVAARTDANMRVMTEALESLREAFTTQVDLFQLWSLFDEHLGRAGLTLLQPPMALVHRAFEQAVIEHVIEHVAAAGRDDATAGASAWLRAAAECFGDVRWRYNLFSALIEARLPAVATLPAPFSNQRTLDELAACAATGRWSETYDWFSLLAHEPRLEEECRARMLVILAEIQLYHFRQTSKAHDWLKRAESLAPNHPRVLIAWGEWHLEHGSEQGRKEAERHFRKVIAEHPRRDDGYVNLGELYERANDFDAAEVQYEQAILSAPGSLGGYVRLWRLLGKPRWFDERRERRDQLLRRILSLDPDEARYMVDEGDALRDNRRWSEARALFQRGQGLAKNRLDLRTGLAYVWLEEAKDAATPSARVAECLSHARQEGERTLVDFPSSPDAFWVMCTLTETAKLWSEAAEWYGRLRGLHAEWEPTTLHREGIARWWLQDWERAKACLLRVAELDPSQPNIAIDLSGLGDGIRKAGNAEAALVLYDEARRLQGEAGESDYQNRLGHIAYERCHYSAAAVHYEQAFKLRPNNAVLLSNFALALAATATPGQIEAELERVAQALQEAVRLAPDEADYTTRLRDTLRKLDFVRRYGEPALQFDHVGTPIRVELEASLVSSLLKGGGNELSRETQQAVIAMRERVAADTGVQLPGIMFATLEGEEIGLGSARIGLFNDAPLVHTVPGAETVGTSDLSSLISWLEAELRRSLDRFVSHDLVANLLTQLDTPECSKVRESPLLLGAFVRFLQARLRSTGSIAFAADDVQHFRVPTLLEPVGMSPWSWADVSPSPISLALGSRYTEAEQGYLLASLDDARDALRNVLGLLIPRLRVEIDLSLPERGFRLAAEHAALTPMQGLAADEVWIATEERPPEEWSPRPLVSALSEQGYVVRASAAEAEQRYPGGTIRDSATHASIALGFELGRSVDTWIDDAQLEHRLAEIVRTFPALVRTVRARFERSELAQLLRMQLLVTGSMRHFANALEIVLQTHEVTATRATAPAHGVSAEP